MSMRTVRLDVLDAVDVGHGARVRRLLLACTNRTIPH